MRLISKLSLITAINCYLFILMGCSSHSPDNPQLQQTDSLLVSVAINGGNSNGTYVSSASISDDGRFIAFASDSDNLVMGDTNNQSDIFVRDMESGITSRVSISSDGSEARYDSMNEQFIYRVYGSQNPSISANGRYVAFSSMAENLVPDDNNTVKDNYAYFDIFVHDRELGITERVSVDSNGNEVSQNYYGSSAPSISADGTYVAYQSKDEIVLPDTNLDELDIYVYNRILNEVIRASESDTGEQTVIIPPNAGSAANSSPSISGDGRYIVFLSRSDDLDPSDTNGITDVYLHDQLTSTTKRISKKIQSTGVSELDGVRGYQFGQSFYEWYGPKISKDGRYIVYHSTSNFLVENDQNGITDIFLYDRFLSTTTRVSVNNFGVELNNSSFAPHVSANGRYIAFTSYATNVDINDSSSTPTSNIGLVHDTLTGITARVSSNFILAMSANGQYIVSYGACEDNAKILGCQIYRLTNPLYE